MSTYFIYKYILNAYTITDVQVWSHTSCTYSSLGQIRNIWWDTHVGVATSECRMELYIYMAYFCSFKIFESCSKLDHVVCNIEPAFIFKSLLHALLKMIYILLGQIYYLVKSWKLSMQAVKDIPKNRSRASTGFLEDGGRFERWRNYWIRRYGCR